MRITNISGSTQQLVFGVSSGDGFTHPISRRVDHNATIDLPDRSDILASAQEYAQRGIITIDTAPADMVSNLGVPVVVQVTVGAAPDTTVTVAGEVISLGAGTANAEALVLRNAVNGNASLRAQGVFARGFGGSDAAKVAIELPAPLTASSVVTSLTKTTLQTAPVAPEALQCSIRSVVAAGAALTVVTGLRNILHCQVSAVRSGVLLAATPGIVYDGGIVRFSSNGAGGAVNFANGDVVTVVAYGVK